MWQAVQWLTLAILIGLIGWALWRYRPRPAHVTITVTDPFAGEVAEFRRAVSDWSRG